MSERELPRPATPGPWHAQEPVNGFDNCWFVWATRGPNDDPSDEPIARMAHDRLNRVQAEDAAAIAALPEWIEDRDRWKARAEKAEALAVAVLTWVHADEDAASDAALMDAIRAYERHGFADAA